MSHRTRTAVIEAATWVVLTGLVILASAAGALAGGCTTTELSGRVELPDGSEYEANTLTICVIAKYTPVLTLHKTYVDGMPVGMLISKREMSEAGEEGQPFMMFLRDSSGTYRLYGYARPTGGRLVTYMLDRPSATATPWPDETFVARKGSGTGVGTDGTDAPILVAATAR